MEISVVLLLSLALAMDAFVLAMTLGLAGLTKNTTNKVKVGLTFGIFQALMFVFGFFALSLLGNKFSDINDYIAAVLLTLLGGNMIREAVTEKEDKCENNPCLGKGCKKSKCLKTGAYRYLSVKVLLIYGTATSIDSFAAGVSYGLQYNDILFASLSIGIITAILSFFGTIWGVSLKKFIGNKADIVGGLILLGLAIKSIL